jgi:hypothetical protein
MAAIYSGASAPKTMKPNCLKIRLRFESPGAGILVWKITHRQINQVDRQLHIRLIVPLPRPSGTKSIVVMFDIYRTERQCGADLFERRTSKMLKLYTRYYFQQAPYGAVSQKNGCLERAIKKANLPGFLAARGAARLLCQVCVSLRPASLATRLIGVVHRGVYNLTILLL